MATLTNIICTNNSELDIQSNGGALKIGTSSAATNISIGNSTSTSGITLTTGSAGTVFSGFAQGALVTSSAGKVSTVTGTAGFVLTANSGAAPSFQAAPSGGIVTIDGTTGSITGTTVTINGGTTGLTTTGSSATMSLGGTLVVANGGTGVASVTVAPTATAFAGWDANSNLSANNHINASNTITVAAGTTTLTVASAQIQYVIGSTGNQIVKLPVTSTLTVGFQFQFVMNVTGYAQITIQSSGGNNISLLSSHSGITTLTCALITGTTAASWIIGAGSYNDASNNVGVGPFTFQNLTSGTQNTLMGSVTGQSVSSGSNNTSFGYNSLSSLSTGSQNTMIGAFNNYGSGNPTDTVIIGYNAGRDSFANGAVLIGSGVAPSCVSTNPSTAIGYFALNGVTTGSYNTVLGYQAGSSLTVSDSSNIFIGHNINGTAGNNHFMQIGAGTGTGTGQINNCQISGISTISSSSSSTMVVVNSSNQLTTDSSVAIVYPTSNVTTTSVTLVPGYIYTMNDASLITATLPTSAALGTTINIVGNGAGGWKIVQNASQQINSTATSTTAGTGGSLSSGGRYDSVKLVCTVANTNWAITAFVGILAFV